METRQPLAHLFPTTQANVAEVFDRIYAPWVKQMGMTDFVIRPGYCSIRLPQDPALQFSEGAICGQAIMAAIDTAAALAVCTDRAPRGTAYQHTQFLRPAAGEDLKVEATVVRSGKSSAYVECGVTLIGSDRLAAHAVLEFAY